MNLKQTSENLGIKALGNQFLSTNNFPKEDAHKIPRHVIRTTTYYQPSLEVTKIQIGQQEVVDPINYDKTKAKKKFKVIKEESHLTMQMQKDFGKSIIGEDDEYNQTFQLGQNPIYGGGSASHHVSFNTTMEEPASHIKFMELKRFIFQLENIVEFSNDDASDVSTLNRMLEQCTNLRLYLNIKNLTVTIMSNILKRILSKIQGELNIGQVQQSQIDSYMSQEISQNLPQKLKKMLRQFLQELDIQEQRNQRSPFHSRAPSEDPTVQNDSELEVVTSNNKYVLDEDVIDIQNGEDFKQYENIQQYEPPIPDQNQTVNEIIVKIEMKKFQNLINNRLQRKNNLVTSDTNRVFPLNKIIDGSAKEAEAPMGFTDGILKINPKLFKYYEKMNRHKRTMTTGNGDGSPSSSPKRTMQTIHGSTFTFKGDKQVPQTSYGITRPFAFEKLASPPKTGFAGKREPTTYIVNDQGEIGINTPDMAKKSFAHERTISVFATTQLQKTQGSITTLSMTKSNVNTERLKSQQTQYKNKYGLTIKNLKNVSSQQPTARISLAEKYRLPPVSFFADNDSEIQSDREPFGWKIGIRDRDSKFAQDTEKTRQERNLQRLRNQKKQQQQLQRGIDKLTHNQFYREMYEKFKDGQSKYPNELARILVEDCESRPQIMSQGELNPISRFKKIKTPTKKDQKIIQGFNEIK